MILSLSTIHSSNSNYLSDKEPEEEPIEEPTPVIDAPEIVTEITPPEDKHSEDTPSKEIDVINDQSKVDPPGKNEPDDSESTKKDSNIESGQLEETTSKDIDPSSPLPPDLEHVHSKV